MKYPKYTKIYYINCLYDDIEKNMADGMIKELKNNNINLLSFSMISYDDWDEMMDIIISDCETKHEIPILHLDMHGDEHGYCEMEWSKIIDKITALNKASHNTLFLSLNVCQGLLIYNHIPFGNYPISYNTIGSYEKVNAKDGQDRFLNMYLDYFTNQLGGDMNRSISVFYKTQTFRTLGLFVLKHNNVWCNMIKLMIHSIFG